VGGGAVDLKARKRGKGGWGGGWEGYD